MIWLLKTTVRIFKVDNICKHKHTNDTTSYEAHAAFFMIWATCRSPSFPTGLSGVWVYHRWIYTTYVSTILKHIFFAIELGLPAAPSGLHILEKLRIPFFLNGGWTPLGICRYTLQRKNEHTHTSLRASKFIFRELSHDWFPKYQPRPKCVQQKPKLSFKFTLASPPIIRVPISTHYQGSRFHFASWHYGAFQLFSEEVQASTSRKSPQKLELQLRESEDLELLQV